jgi:hypothetical protein
MWRQKHQQYLPVSGQSSEERQANNGDDDGVVNDASEAGPSQSDPLLDNDSK